MWVKNEKLIKVYENDIVNGTVRIPSSINKIADLAFFGLDSKQKPHAFDFNHELGCSLQ